MTYELLVLFEDDDLKKQFPELAYMTGPKQEEYLTAYVEKEGLEVMSFHRLALTISMECNTFDTILETVNKVTKLFPSIEHDEIFVETKN